MAFNSASKKIKIVFFNYLLENIDLSQKELNKQLYQKQYIDIH